MYGKPAGFSGIQVTATVVTLWISSSHTGLVCHRCFILRHPGCGFHRLPSGMCSPDLVTSWDYLSASVKKTPQPKYDNGVSGYIYAIKILPEECEAHEKLRIWNRKFTASLRLWSPAERFKSLRAALYQPRDLQEPSQVLPPTQLSAKHNDFAIKSSQAILPGSAHWWNSTSLPLRWLGAAVQQWLNVSATLVKYDSQAFTDEILSP